MRNADRLLILLLSAAALTACHKAQPQPSNDEEMSVDENGPTAQLPGNAEIETLPADESSTTPSNQLQKGYDNPDVNDLGNSH